jgi:hypothetical protein
MKLERGIKMNEELEKKDKKKEADEKQFEKLGEYNIGRIRGSKWTSNNGISYSLQVGYKKNDEWVNKKITLLDTEIQGVISVLRKIIAM